MGASPTLGKRTARVLVCVLAAGASSRMGFPKLLATWPGPDGADTCLLARARRAALGSRAAQVAVVTGAYADEMAPVLEGLGEGCGQAALEKPREGAEGARQNAGQAGAAGSAAAATAGADELRLVELRNDAWPQGQATSVRLAAQYASEHGFDAVIFMAADQPFVEAEHLDALIAAFEEKRCSEAPDAAPAPYALRSRCGTRQGNPCLFPREALLLFETLTGDEGARQLFRSGALAALPADIPPTPGHDVFCDLDTPEEFAGFVEGRRAWWGRR